MKRRMFAVVLGLVLTLALSAPALAHICSNQNKQTDAGSVGTLTIDFTQLDENGEPLETFAPSGRKNGGFITIVVIAPWGTQTYSVFNHGSAEGVLPEGALNAGPGDDLCDGKGVDFAFQCFLESAP